MFSIPAMTGCVQQYYFLYEVVVAVDLGTDNTRGLGAEYAGLFV